MFLRAPVVACVRRWVRSRSLAEAKPDVELDVRAQQLVHPVAPAVPQQQRSRATALSQSRPSQ